MKITIPAYLHALHSYDDTYSFHIFGTEMVSCGYIPLASTEVEFERPSPEEVIRREVTTLRQKIIEVRSSADKQVNELRDQLAKLESIGYSPSTITNLEPRDVP